jgi:hypothetical protein
MATIGLPRSWTVWGWVSCKNTTPSRTWTIRSKPSVKPNRFAQLDWPAIHQRYARPVNPLLRKELACFRVRWVVDQAEFATDLLFQSPAALAELYQVLLQFATVTFTPKDIVGFLNRK